MKKRCFTEEQIIVAHLQSRLRELAVQYPRYGYLILHSLLRQEGLVVSRKLMYRLYSAERLEMRTK